MKHAKWIAGLALLSALSALSACRNEQVGELQQTQIQQQKALADIETRLQALERKPKLTFTLKNKRVAINEKMFTPLLTADTDLIVKGDNMPPNFYVDVMLKVDVPGIPYQAVQRQIFPVVNGRSHLQMQQTLPQHDLKRGEIKVTLQPMTWYRGQIINEDMVRYE